MKQKWLPEIAVDLCTGCGDCVAACGPASLALVDKVAVLINPDTCGSEQHCIEPCAHHAISMTWRNATGNKQRGKWRFFDVHHIR